MKVIIPGKLDLTNIDELVIDSWHFSDGRPVSATKELVDVPLTMQLAIVEAVLAYTINVFDKEIEELKNQIKEGGS